MGGGFFTEATENRPPREMVRRGWSRKYSNRQISLLKSVFAWAVAEELIPPAIHQSLQAVKGCGWVKPPPPKQGNRSRQMPPRPPHKFVHWIQRGSLRIYSVYQLHARDTGDQIDPSPTMLAFLEFADPGGVAERVDDEQHRPPIPTHPKLHSPAIRPWRWSESRRWNCGADKQGFAVGPAECEAGGALRGFQCADVLAGLVVDIDVAAGDVDIAVGVGHNGVAAAVGKEFRGELEVLVELTRQVRQSSSEVRYTLLPGSTTASCELCVIGRPVPPAMIATLESGA